MRKKQMEPVSEKKQSIVTIGEVLDMMERKKSNEKKYRLKVSYKETNQADEFIFNIRQAMLDSRK